MFIRVILLSVIFLAMLSQSAFCGTLKDCNGGRYEDNNNGTVSDCRTGLIWLKDADCMASFNGIDKSLGSLSWYDAGKWTAGLANGTCGLTDGSAAGDWRLPTKTELMAMIQSAKKQGFTLPVLTDATGTVKWAAGNPFNNVEFQPYWTSVTDQSNNANAWYVDLTDAAIGVTGKSTMRYVWPVRAGNDGSFGYLFVE
jgi:hypothetical protein